MSLDLVKNFINNMWIHSDREAKNIIIGRTVDSKKHFGNVFGNGNVDGAMFLTYKSLDKIYKIMDSQCFITMDYIELKARNNQHLMNIYNKIKQLSSPKTIYIIFYIADIDFYTYIEEII